MSDAVKTAAKPHRFTTAGVIFSIIFSLISLGIAYRSQWLSEKALTDVQRAFIYIQPTHLNPIVNAAGEKEWLWSAQIGNSGNTPTFRMEYSLACTTDPTKLFDETLLGPTRVKGHAIGPKVTDAGLELCLKPTKELHEVQGTTVLYLFGRAIYQDIFQKNFRNVDMLRYTEGKNRISEFCVKVTDLVELEKPVDGRYFNARTRHCDSHNCVDEQCR